MPTESTPSPAPDPAVDPSGAPTTPVANVPVPPPVLAAAPAGAAYAPPRPAPSAPVGWVIAAMLLFWPTGIPALLASHRAARAFGAADTETAVRESANAKRWGIVSVCVGAALIALSVLISIAWAVLAAVAINEVGTNGGWRHGLSNEMPFDNSGRSGTQNQPNQPNQQGSRG